MSDPLGLIGSAGGLPPIRPAGPGATPGGKIDPSAPSFKDLLMQNIKEVNDLELDASAAVEDLAAGRRSDAETVLLATQKADMAFQMLLQVRNKVVDAYDELKQIRV
ncbi:MAG: flagellar hook-basal body complex protein FliE [Phycisphaeraceae bacterium]|nr:flagellar hook-basal body complex protein FliE [Phycisphaeraceae bacterium]